MSADPVRMKGQMEAAYYAARRRHPELFPAPKKGGPSLGQQWAAIAFEIDRLHGASYAPEPYPLPVRLPAY